MENEILNVKDFVPDLVRSTHLSIKLEGWSASAALIAISLSVVAICGIKTLGIQKINSKETVG